MPRKLEKCFIARNGLVDKNNSLEERMISVFQSSTKVVTGDPTLFVFFCKLIFIHFTDFQIRYFQSGITDHAKTYHICH